jgi:hypothetical protein
MPLFSLNAFPLNWGSPETLLISGQPVWRKLVLPSPELAFPVQAPYRVASDLSKLEGPALALDDLYQTYFNAKLKLLEQRPDSLLLPQTAIPTLVWEEIWLLLCLDQAASAQALGLDPAGLAQLGRAQQLSLAMQEDWVLMSPEGHFEAGSVCFPSGWAPGEKFGLSLAAIHAPVADGEALRKASQALTRAMLQKGPFQRFVWTLTRNKNLARHPGYPTDLQAESDSALYFRYERQTTLALPRSGRALFLIRVYVVPLNVALAGKTGPPGQVEEADKQANERLAMLKGSLSSMSEAVIAYKGLRDIREQVLAMPPFLASRTP